MSIYVMRKLLIFLFSIICATAFAQGPQNVIPVPSDVIITDGTYSFESEPKVSVTFVKKGIAPEGYELTVTTKGVKIKAATEAFEQKLMKLGEEIYKQQQAAGAAGADAAGAAPQPENPKKADDGNVVDAEVVD